MDGEGGVEGLRVWGGPRDGRGGRGGGVEGVGWAERWTGREGWRG